MSSLSELKGRLEAGDLSSAELVDDLTERIAAVNPPLRALSAVLDAAAGARASDERRARGQTVGPLDGIPFSVKDNVDVAGQPTSQGVVGLAGEVAAADSPVVAALRAAGAIPIARGNMPDFALRYHTDNALTGATINPRDPALTPGGSSGGDAVAVATEMVPLGIGNDLGGSLRWPAWVNGIAALRPSLGRVARTREASPIAVQLMEVDGPLARRVGDLRLAFAAIVAPDARDPWHVPLPAEHRTPAPRRFRVLEAGAPEPLAQAAAALVEAGYERVDGAPDVDAPARLWLELLSADARPLWQEIAPLASPGATAFMEAYLTLTDPSPPDGLLAERLRLAREWGAQLAEVPLVLAPVSLAPPFTAAFDQGGPQAARAILDQLAPTLAVNALGLPAVAVPTGLANGMPEGVQLIGPRFGEAALLDAAEEIERRTEPVAAPVVEARA